MSKLYKCEKCLREFVRKQHLIQHYNRKIPCVNPPNQIIFYKDILPLAIRGGNIIVNKILPTEEPQDEKPTENRVEIMPETNAEPLSQTKAEHVPQPLAENLPEPKAEIIQPTSKALEANLTQPMLSQENMQLNRQPNLNSPAKGHHNKTIKINLKFRGEYVKKALEKLNEYDELYKRVMKFFESDEVKLSFQKDNINPVNFKFTLDELRGLYRRYKDHIDSEYFKIKILD